MEICAYARARERRRKFYASGVGGTYVKKPQFYVSRNGGVRGRSQSQSALAIWRFLGRAARVHTSLPFIPFNPRPSEGGGLTPHGRARPRGQASFLND